MMDRRRLITGLISLVAAPAIVRCSSLMAVKPVTVDFCWELHGIDVRGLPPEMIELLRARMADAFAVMKRAMVENLYGPADGTIAA